MAKNSTHSHYEIGDLVWVNFPFEEDPTKSKERLALILDIKNSDFLCAKITGSNKYLSKDFYALPSPPCIKDSYVDLGKTYNFKAIHIRAKQSSLNPIQLAILLNEFKKITP